MTHVCLGGDTTLHSNDGAEGAQARRQEPAMELVWVCRGYSAQQ